MSFKAKFKVDGNEYNVLSARYGLYQETDATGRPSSITRGGEIKVRIESTADTSLSDWMFNNFEQKSGSIAFLKRDSEAISKELKFTDAYMVRYIERFDATGTKPMYEDFMISARCITMGNGEHLNAWV